MLPKNKSIFVFLLLIVAILNIFMIALLSYTLHTSRERKEVEVRTTVANLALLMDKSVSGTSREIDLSLREIQVSLERELREHGRLNQDEVNALVKHHESWINRIANIQVADHLGRIRYGHPVPANSNFSYQQYDFFTEHQHNAHSHLSISKLVQSPISKDWVHVFSRCYHYPDGRFAGIVTASIPASYFSKLISGLDLGSKGIVLVRDLDMTLIARHPIVGIPAGQTGAVGGSPELTQLLTSGAQTGTFYSQQTADGINRINTFRRLSSMPIFVVVGLGEDDYLAQWYNDVEKAIILGLIFLLATTIVSWLLWNQIQTSEMVNRRNRMLLQNSRDGIHILDLQGKLIEASDSFFRMIGYPPEKVLGQHITYWDSQFNQKDIDELIQKCSDMPDGLRLETAYRNAKGELYSVEITAILVNIDGSRFIFSAARDISARKKAEENLRIAATAFESQVGMLITDANLKILRANRAFLDITGYSLQEIVGQTPRLFQSGLHDKSFYASMWDIIRTQGFWQGELWNKRKNGKLYPQLISIATVRDNEDVITHYVATLTDISAHKASEEKIRILASYDSLTKLPNRRLFLERLERAIQYCERQQHQGAVLFINLDHFKALNDTEGHYSGDRLLEQVAYRLLHCVAEHNMVARLGSDEFVILLDDLGSSEQEAMHQAENLAKQILYALSQPYHFGQSEYRSSASIGISLFGQEHENVQEPLKRADMAMSEAKTIGRNTLRFFNPKIQSQIKERAEIDAGLRVALEKNQFVLYYQPQMNSAEQVIGVEALIRWKHPDQGLISPARFIPVAEENGLIIPLGYWVLKMACQQLNQWANNPQTAHLTIAVNVSASQFAQQDFAQQVLDILDDYDVPAHLLKLELTESSLVMEVNDVIDKMMILKRHGVTFSLDDFGTGYSSLTYLKRIPIDQLKIDQSFVRDITVNANDAEIAKMIIILAKTLGIAVLAEGVESEVQRDILEQYGCYLYQGYFFARPMPVVQFEEFYFRNLILC